MKGKEHVQEGDSKAPRVPVDIEKLAMELKWTKAALHESDQCYRLLADSEQDLVFIVDRDGYMQYVNSFLAKLFGLPQEEFVEQLLEKFFPADTVRVQKQNLQKVLKTGKSSHFEEKITVVGREMWLDTLLIPVRNVPGEVNTVLGISRDISERKRAEETLSRSEARYRAIVEDQTELICRFTTEWILTFVNDAYCRYFGKTREEITGKSFMQFIPNGDQKKFEKLFDSLSRKNPIVTHEHRVIVPSAAGQEGAVTGGFRWQQWTNRALFDSEDHIVEFQAVGRDVTERRQVEEALKESEARFRALAETTSAAIFIYQDDRFCYVNPATEIITGYTKEELLERTAWDVIHPAFRDIIKMRGTARLRGEAAPSRYEMEFLSKAGDDRWIDVSTGLIVFKGKLAVLVTAFDITERKRAEERLRKINECFLSFGPDPIKNINHLTALCGELLGATSALYSRLDRKMLCTWGQWNVPPDFKSVDIPQGHICYDVINQASDEVLVIRNLHETQYAYTDPNVKAYNLKTYIGRAVRLGDEYVGSLCAVFQNDFIPSKDDERLIVFISSAVAVEEARRHDKEALQKSEVDYRTTINALGDAVHVVDSDLRILLVNDAFTKWIVELKLETAMVGKTPFEAFPFLPDKVRDEYRHVFETGEILATEERMKAGGQEFVTETRKIPLFEGGKVTRIVTVIRNTTHLKRVIEALQEREHFLADVFSSIQDGVSVLDKDMTIIRVNAAMEKWYGHAMPLVGKKCFEAYHGRSEACEVCPTKKTLETARSAYEVVPKKGPGGAIVGWLDLYSFPLFDTDTGQMKGVIEYVRDITERMRAEEALRYRIEFERLISTLSTKFIKLPPEEVDKEINGVLETIGKFAGVDRSYVFQAYDNETRADNTHEWCAEGIEPLIDKLKGLSSDFAPWLVEKLKRDEVIHVPRLDDLPPEAVREKELFRSQKVKSVVIVPMVFGKAIVGLLGFDSVREEKAWSGESIALLRIVGEILANALTHKEAEETIKLVAEQWEMTFNSITDLVSLQDVECTIVRVNKAFADTFKKKPDELIGKKCYEILHGTEAQIVHCPMKRTLATKQPAAEEIFEPKLGFHLEITTSPIFDERGEMIGSVHIAKDISERKKAEQELEKLNMELLNSNKRLKQFALRDAHTGLYNHRYLSEVIEAEFFRARRYVHPLSVIMLDVDYFKSINDVYGHQFGDLVLKQLARQLKKMVRQYDIVGRFGGEEFVVISPGIDRSRAFALAQRILDAVGLYNFGNATHTVRLKLSLAAASYPEDRVVKGMELIKLADQILNKAKEFGGDRVYSSLDTGKGRRGLTAKADKGADAKSLQQKLERLTKRANQSLVEAVFAFAKTIKLKDYYTGEHVDRTVHYTTEIAKLLSLSKEETERIRQAAQLHDLGKIGISEKILLKPSKLSKKEIQEIRLHPQIGVDIIRPIHVLHDIIPFILYHHERWDGKGYPEGLRREEIPMGARIIAISDVYQALTSRRAYRKAYSKSEAIRIIKSSSGTQFDPKIVNMFLRVLADEKINKKG